MTQRTLVWRGLDAFRAEIAFVELETDRLRARGVQLGIADEPYVLRYELETGPAFVTERLLVEAEGGASLDLRRAGNWPVAEALDCDLGLCPLTNTMPILRHGLHLGGEPRNFVMAWVSVPDLTVHRSEQRYEPLGEGLVRYRGSHRPEGRAFDLEVDGHGLVIRYPGLAERVGLA